MTCIFGVLSVVAIWSQSWKVLGCTKIYEVCKTQTVLFILL